MLFALICTDKPGSAELRTNTRPDHVAYLNSLGDKMKLAGPFLDDAGNAMGSLVVVEAESRSDAEAMAASDPYKKAGLFASVEIRAWRWTLKNPEVK
jgi:uncharacterized protein